jgi:hypothetical protein
MAATRGLMRGDWQAAFKAVNGLSVWALVPQREAVLAMLQDKLKEEALRTYLFTYRYAGLLSCTAASGKAAQSGDIVLCTPVLWLAMGMLVRLSCGDAASAAASVLISSPWHHLWLPRSIHTAQFVCLTPSCAGFYTVCCVLLFVPRSAQYLSLSLEQLCTMFELPEKRVYSIVSKMMFTEELHGSWDQPTKTIVMHNLEASKVRRGQLLGLGLAAVSMLLSAWG